MGNQDCSKQITEYRLKENIFSAADTTYGITNCTTNTVSFKITSEAKTNEQSEQKDDERVICVADGNELFRLRKAVISRRYAVLIDDASTNTTVYSMRRKHFLSCLDGTGIWKGEGFKGKPALEIRGNVVEKDFNIFDKNAGQVAAIICKEAVRQSSVMIGSEIYFVRVYPGYDDALLVLIAISLAEQYRETSASDGILCIGPCLDFAIGGLCFL